MHTRWVLVMLVAGLLVAMPAQAQRLACGGHRINWIGGAPGAGVDRTPSYHQLPSVDEPTGADRGGVGDASAAGFDPTHYPIPGPTIPEPAGMNRERWDALVFNAFDSSLREDQTYVLDRAVVPTIRICIQSADDSYTGERLAPYADASWWRRQIDRWTSLRWNGEIRIAACTGDVSNGWIHVREGRPGEVQGTAHAFSLYQGRPHLASWRYSVIAWHPDRVRNLSESIFEKTLAHELGHVLGFWHVPPESGYVMAQGGESSWPEEESSLAQLAYRVGPNVRYPGLVRPALPDDPEQDPADRAALMALYEATDGKNWTDSANWGTDEPFDYWHGVVTDEAGRVAKLDLHINNLSGPMPPELGDVSNLRVLVLEGNDLTGPLPPELGDLSNLERLNLSGNNLTGPLPPELGDLASLVNLNLSRNNVTGPIPPALGRMPSLWGLNLDSNNLTGPIPPALGRMPSLWGLNLDSNNLTGPIPPELGDLPSLEILKLRSNNLSGPVPPELGRLTSLEWLILNDNNLTGPVPTEVGNLSNLDILRLGANRLTGSLPSSMTSLRVLHTLDIANNAGLCAPADDAFQEWLATVRDFQGNTCGIEPEQDPTDRAALMALYQATDGESWTNGANWGTDERFANWHGVTTDREERVVRLSLSDNNLRGPIPAELGNLSNLENLGLGFNNLTGPIPPELGNLSNLENLRLGFNNLTGPIPPELGNLSDLESLDCKFNELTGPIPPELGRLSNLRVLGLNSNNLTGPIPPELARLSNLWVLWLSVNHLTGPIPPALGLGSLSNLEHLTLGYNDLTGPIPAELGRLSDLEDLSLRSNNLTGRIPPELGDLYRLQTLVVSRNRLTGPVPAELGELSNLEILNLRANDLTAQLPSSMTSLRILQLLDIADNAGLCAPADEAFQAWLATVPDFRGETCGANPVPALPGIWLALVVLLWCFGAGLLGRS